MNYLLISILIGVFFIASIVLGLIIGLHYGQKIQRGEQIELPQLNPIKAVKESKLTKEEEAKQKEVQDFIDAMENYDGYEVR